jgi:hypothetical protein
MELWIAVGSLWLSLLCIYVRIRQGRTVAQWCDAIRFRQSDEASPHQLFGYLLSGNLALLEGDDFNQLSSILAVRRIRKLLAWYWGIHSREDFHRAVDQRLGQLGTMSSQERDAFAAWRNNAPIDTESYGALLDACVFLSVDAGIVTPCEITGRHLDMRAWDIQQLAYILRLGFTLGYVTREFAESMLARLQREARIHYASWKDYSLSSLVGRGLRNRIDLFDPGNWQQIARTHVVLTAPASPIAQAAPWGRSRFWFEGVQDAAQTSRGG